MVNLIRLPNGKFLRGKNGALFAVGTAAECCCCNCEELMPTPAPCTHCAPSDYPAAWETPPDIQVTFSGVQPGILGPTSNCPTYNDCRDGTSETNVGFFNSTITLSPCTNAERFSCQDICSYQVAPGALREAMLVRWMRVEYMYFTLTIPLPNNQSTTIRSWRVRGILRNQFMSPEGTSPFGITNRCSQFTTLPPTNTSIYFANSGWVSDLWSSGNLIMRETWKYDPAYCTDTCNVRGADWMQCLTPGTTATVNGTPSSSPCKATARMDNVQMQVTVL